MHLGISRIAEDAASAQCARAKFHTALKPADDVSFGEFCSDVGCELLEIVIVARFGVMFFERPGNLFVGEFWSQVRSLHGVGLASHLAFVALLDVPHGIGRADGASGVSGGGLDPNIVENSSAQQFSVRHAIERDAAGHHQILAAGQLSRRAGNLDYDFFGHLLDREGQVHINLGKFRLWLAAWHPEKLFPLRLVGHFQAGGVFEVIHVQQNRAVFADID